MNRNQWLWLKKQTIKDAIQWSAESWDHITPHSLRSSWNNFLQRVINEPEIFEQKAISSEDLDEGAIVAPWILESEEDVPGAEMNDDELIQFALDEKQPQEEPAEEMVRIPHIIPMSEAVILLRVILPTFEKETQSTMEKIKVIQNIILRWTVQHSAN